MNLFEGSQSFKIDCLQLQVQIYPFVLKKGLYIGFFRYKSQGLNGYERLKFNSKKYVPFKIIIKFIDKFNF